jgi:hypothetical protein
MYESASSTTSKTSGAINVFQNRIPIPPYGGIFYAAWVFEKVYKAKALRFCDFYKSLHTAGAAIFAAL